MTAKEALKRIKNIPVFTTTSSFVETYASTAYKNEIEVIETALNEYNLMKKAKIFVADKKISDEDLDKLKNQHLFVDSLSQCEVKPLFDKETQKKLKVLEIIKSKPTTIGLCLVAENRYKGFFVFDTYEEYQKRIGRWYKREYMYNETECNLLKEYLK